MILVDSSVWANSSNEKYPEQAIVSEQLADLLDRDAVLSHPFVYGELLLGQGGARRSAIIKMYPDLPPVSAHEVLDVPALWDFIKAHRLDNKGIGIVDATLLFAVYTEAVRRPGVQIWTHDKALKAVAVSMKVAYEPEAK